VKVYRAILIHLKSIDCNVERLMALTNLAYRGYIIKPPDLSTSAYSELKAWSFRNSLVFGTNPKKWLATTWFPMRIQRKINGVLKGTNASPLFIDFDRGLMKLRYICHAEMSIPKWLYDRVDEGGDIKYALLGLKNGKPYLAIVAEKVYHEQSSSGYIMVVDVNSWKYGIVIGLITPKRRIAMIRRLRPNLRKIDTMYRQATKLEKKYGKLRRLGLHKSSEGMKLRKMIKQLRSKIHRYLRDFANKAVHEVIDIVLRFRAKIVVDYFYEESRRELLEEKLYKGLTKIYLYGLPRFVELLENQANWYGIPIEFRRLYSSICPKCGNTLIQQENRVMVCNRCGFRDDRDIIPIYWAVRTTQLYTMSEEQ